MGPADTDTDIFSQPIFLPIPIQIYLHQHIGHRYWYRYFHFGRYLADNWHFCQYFGRYPCILTDIWPIPISSLQIPIYRYRPYISSNRYIGPTLQNIIIFRFEAYFLNFETSQLFANANQRKEKKQYKMFWNFDNYNFPYNFKFSLNFQQISCHWT